ncbi:MAG: hypothetical protein N4A40_13020 [Tissierellales bacterium]|jgi:DNA repair protein RadC|nr:hypothetical protein [Tissierellales bacterium]
MNNLVEKARMKGFNSLNDFEVVSLITSINQVDVLSKFKSFDDLFNNIDKLKITELQRQKLRALFEIGFRMKSKMAFKKVIKCSKDVESISLDMRKLEYEEYRVLLLDVQKEVIRQTNISADNISRTFPRIVFKEAIIENADSMIIVQYSKKSDISPSQKDLDLTKRLIETGELVGIDVIEHIIIGRDGYYSLADEGYM